MGKKLTIEQLIAQKEKLKERKQKKFTLEVKSLDCEITVKIPTNALLMEAQGRGESDASKADMYLLYQCVVEPDLKSQKLQDAYKCVEPMDIVNEIFMPGEVASIAGKIMELGGYGEGVQLKN